MGAHTDWWAGASGRQVSQQRSCQQMVVLIDSSSSKASLAYKWCCYKVTRVFLATLRPAAAPGRSLPETHHKPPLVFGSPTLRLVHPPAAMTQLHGTSWMPGFIWVTSFTSTA